MNQGTRGQGIGSGWAAVLAAVFSAALAGCASVDEQQTLAKQQERLEVLSDQTSALSTRNLELVDENAALERERREAALKLEQAEREARQLAAMVQARAHRDVVDKQVDLALAKASAANTAAANSTPVESDLEITGLGRDPIPAAAPSGRATGTGPFHLRIISLPATEINAAIVRDIALALERDKGIAGAVARRSGDFWVVDVGTFASIRAPEAVALKHQLRTMRYKGRQEFATAYFAQY